MKKQELIDKIKEYWINLHGEKRAIYVREMEYILNKHIPEQVDYEAKIKELIEFYRGTTIVDWIFIEKALQSLLPTTKE